MELCGCLLDLCEGPLTDGSNFEKICLKLSKILLDFSGCW
jgi:hypothetical protein